MLGGDLNSYPSTGIKVDLYATPFGGESGDQIVQEKVCEMFVKDSFLSVSPEV
jgi:hypothetical protein